MTTNKIYCMDGMAGMGMIPDGFVDMILCDLPYGVTSCSWDSVLPFPLLWREHERIIKDNGAIVLTGCQPFTSDLIASNRQLFRYCWYWKKNLKTGVPFSHVQPMRCIEDVVVFYKHKPTYNPQGLIKLETPILKQSKRKGGSVYQQGLDKTYTQADTHYPSHFLEFPCERGLHPTQKPVTLFEYLIRTYTNEGELVLDNCMGSGTTAVACIRSKRRYIGFEISEEYCGIAEERVGREATDGSNTDTTQKL